MKTLKIYKADAILCFSLTLDGGRRTYVRFEPFSRGGSYFSTTDTELQAAIENCGAFKNGKIKLQETDAQPETEKETTEVNSVESAKKEGYEVVESVQNCADARIWLREHFGDNLSFKSRADILAAAESHKVYFPNLKK